MACVTMVATVMTTGRAKMVACVLTGGKERTVEQVLVYSNEFRR